MPYKIAVASSDGKNIDLSFGGAKEFYIYEIGEDNSVVLLETRKPSKSEIDSERVTCTEGCGEKEKEGCSGGGGHIPKMELVEDCRCVLCKKIGFQVKKQLEKRAIATFDIEYNIDDALEKIVMYFDRMDHHKSLRGIANK